LFLTKERKPVLDNIRKDTTPFSYLNGFLFVGVFKQIDKGTNPCILEILPIFVALQYCLVCIYEKKAFIYGKKALICVGRYKMNRKSNPAKNSMYDY